jgi:hypothetical protein
VELAPLVEQVDGFLRAMEGPEWPEGLVMPTIEAHTTSQR